MAATQSLKQTLADAKARTVTLRHSFPLFSLTFLLLLFLKLTGKSVIAISWFWVFFPLWAPIALVVGIVLAMLLIWGILSAIAGIVGYFVRRAQRKAAMRFVDALREAAERNDARGTIPADKPVGPPEDQKQ